MVHLRRFKLNHQLAHHLRGHTVKSRPTSNPRGSLPLYDVASWRLRDKLTPQDIADLVAAFQFGTSQKALAARYGIDVRSVRKLLREHGI